MKSVETIYSGVKLLIFLACVGMFCWLMSNVWRKFTKKTTSIGSR